MESGPELLIPQQIENDIDEKDFVRLIWLNDRLLYLYTISIHDENNWLDILVKLLPRL